MSSANLKIAILSGPYKEHLSAEQVGHSIKKGLKKAMPLARIDVFWLADGGSGTAKRLSKAYSAKKVIIKVAGPNYKETNAEIYINQNKKIALFDVAQACGIHLLQSSERNPSKTSTFGVGEIIMALEKRKIEEIIIGLGDTATIDAGIGMLQAIGWIFKDAHHKELPKKRFDFRKVISLERGIDKYYRPKVICLCDGDTTLYGRKSISRESAEKKGATQKEISKLEEEMKKVGRTFEKYTKKGFSFLERSGSAGGLGAALVTAFDAKLVMGTEFIMKKFNILKRFESYNLIITSEGEINHQTLGGKTPFVVSKQFKKRGVPTIIFVGSKSTGFSRIYKQGTIAILETDQEKISLDKMKKENIGRIFIANKARELGTLLNLKDEREKS